MAPRQAASAPDHARAAGKVMHQHGFSPLRVKPFFSLKFEYCRRRSSFFVTLFLAGECFPRTCQPVNSPGTAEGGRVGSLFLALFFKMPKMCAYPSVMSQSAVSPFPAEHQRCRLLPKYGCFLEVCWGFWINWLCKGTSLEFNLNSEANKWKFLKKRKYWTFFWTWAGNHTKWIFTHIITMI